MSIVTVRPVALNRRQKERQIRRHDMFARSAQTGRGRDEIVSGSTTIWSTARRLRCLRIRFAVLMSMILVDVLPFVVVFVGHVFHHLCWSQYCIYLVVPCGLAWLFWISMILDEYIVYVRSGLYLECLCGSERKMGMTIRRSESE